MIWLLSFLFGFSALAQDYKITPAYDEVAELQKWDGHPAKHGHLYGLGGFVTISRCYGQINSVLWSSNIITSQNRLKRYYRKIINGLTGQDWLRRNDVEITKALLEKNSNHQVLTSVDQDVTENRRLIYLSEITNEDNKFIGGFLNVTLYKNICE